MPPLATVVVNAAMLEKAVVPDDECVGAPPDAAVILDPLRQRLQVIEQSSAFLLAPANKALEVRCGDVQALAPGARVSAYRRMDALELSVGERMMVA